MDLSKGSLFYYPRRTGIAKMIDNGKGVLWIRGKFKDQLPNPYFKVHFYNKTTYTVLIIFWCFYSSWHSQVMWVMKIFNLDTACQGMWSAASKNTFRFKSPIWLSFDVETSKVINCLFTTLSVVCLHLVFFCLQIILVTRIRPRLTSPKLPKLSKTSAEFTYLPNNEHKSRISYLCTDLSVLLEKQVFSYQVLSEFDFETPCIYKIECFSSFGKTVWNKCQMIVIKVF